MVGGAIGIGVTMWLAVDWAADLPETVAFAIAREPFGERSLLERDNARAARQRLLDRAGPGDRVLSLHVDPEVVSMSVRVPDGRRRWLTTNIGGVIDDRFTVGPGEGDGIPIRRVAALDLDAVLRTAERRWRAQRPRPEGPLVSLDIADASPSGWLVIFTSEVPEERRVTAVGLDGRVTRIGSRESVVG